MLRIHMNLSSNGRLLYLLLIIAGAALVTPGHAQTDLREEVDGFYITPTSFIYPAGNNGLDWSYIFSDSGPCNDGTTNCAWYAESFNETGWAPGTAKGGSEIKSLWPNPSGSARSHLWARTTFNLSSGQIPDLMFWVNLQPEIMIYVNGVLALHTNNNYENDPYRYLGMSSDARDALRQGQNTLAIHVPDDGGDMDFDLGLVTSNAMAQPPATGMSMGPEFDEISEWLREVMSNYGIPAGAVAVGMGRDANAEMFLSQGLGHMDKEFTRAVPQDAIFRLASVDKPITKDAIEMLIAGGVTDPAGNPVTKQTKVFPLFSAFNIDLSDLESPHHVVDARMDDVTIQHLIDHTSFIDHVPSSPNRPDFYAALGANVGETTMPDNVRWLHGKGLSGTPCDISSGSCDSEYNSSGYGLLRYVVQLLYGHQQEPNADYQNDNAAALRVTLKDGSKADHLEDYLQATFGSDIYVSRELVEERVTDAAGNLREPWYHTSATPYDRWVAHYTELASSAEAYTTYQQNFDGHNWFNGKMSGSETYTGRITAQNGEEVSYTVLFNQCCRLRYKPLEIFDFTVMLRQKLENIPASAWNSSSGGGFACEDSNSTVLSGPGTVNVSAGSCVKYNHASGDLRLGTWDASGTNVYDVQNCSGGVIEDVVQTLNAFTAVDTGTNFCDHYIHIKQVSHPYDLQINSW